MSNFVHLRTHTEFSLDQGIIRIPDLVKKAKEDNMSAVAISDNQGLFGVIKFYEKTKDNGIKPIIASDLKIYDPEKQETYNMLFIAKNNEGYKNIMRMLSMAYSHKTNGESLVLKEWIKPEYVPNLIALSGAKEGNIGQAILNNDLNKATEEAQYWKDFFGDNFYIELQRDGKDNETQYMDGAITVAQKLNIPVVATNPSVFLNQEDFIFHEAKICIKQEQMLYDLTRERKYNKENYFKTQSEMTELFADIPSAIENTIEIAKKCNLSIKLGVPNLPVFETPNGESVEDYFENLSKDGLRRKLKALYPNLEERKAQAPKYVERLETEMKTIRDMGFIGYFLIVSDFIKWAKENGIPVGAGRGSGAGSLVAYCIDITEIDPIKHELLFERFLNPERVSMPDFDIDFCQDRRGEVIEYVTRKYGENSVSQIGTFGTMAAKSVVRDVGRVLNYPYSLVDGIAKMINMPVGKEIPLSDYLEADEKLNERVEKEPEVKKLMDIAINLEGLTRQIGKHAGGVIISPTTIDDYTPLYQGSDSDGFLVSQFDKDDVEKAGLVKFDFLGLRNLTIVNNCLKLVNQRSEFKDNPLNEQSILEHDPEVYKLFQNSNTTGVFQFEGAQVKGLCKKAKPSNFEDIVALTALNRPGPLGSGMVDIYIERKHGREEIDYLHPSLKQILGPTYGVIVYQEQVMQIAQELAGYTLGGADLLRRAMGKKKPEEMAKQRSVFVEGAKKKHNVPEEQSESIFNLIEKFAEYGFNKSHSAAYTIVSYQTAYLKVHYPVEFYTASMNSFLNDTDQLQVFFEDAKANGIGVLPPDVNKSNYLCTLEDGKIRYGLGALKGVGAPAAAAIEKARQEKGEFTSMLDFFDKVGKGEVNKRTIEPLIRAGAFDCVHTNRAELFDFVPKGIDYLKQVEKKQKRDEEIAEDERKALENPTDKKKKPKKEVIVEIPELESKEDWDEITKLQNEKASVGYYFSDSPFRGYSNKLGGLPAVTPLDTLASRYDEEGEQKVLISGIITNIIPFKSKKGATIKIIDNNGSADLITFSGTLDMNKDWLKTEQFATFLCKLQADRNGEGHSLVVDLIYDFNKTAQITADKAFIALDEDQDKSDTQAKQIQALCSLPENQGDTELVVCAYNPKTGRKNVKIASYNVNCNGKLLSELRTLCGDNWVKLMFKEQLDPYSLVQKKTYDRNNNNNRRSFSV